MKNEIKILGVPPTEVPIHPIIDAYTGIWVKKNFCSLLFPADPAGAGINRRSG